MIARLEIKKNAWMTFLNCNNKQQDLSVKGSKNIAKTYRIKSEKIANRELNKYSSKWKTGLRHLRNTIILKESLILENIVQQV